MRIKTRLIKGLISTIIIIAITIPMWDRLSFVKTIVMVTFSFMRVIIIIYRVITLRKIILFKWKKKM